MRRTPDRHCQADRRDGVILIVVLALLTLLAIVGIAFAVYADTAQRSLRPFRADALEVVEQTLSVADVVGSDLRASLEEDVDFRDSQIALVELSDLVAALQARVAAAPHEPASARQLADLCDLLKDLQARIDVLRQLIEQLESDG
jgi:hypothetical protein